MFVDRKYDVKMCKWCYLYFKQWYKAAQQYSTAAVQPVDVVKN